MAWPRSLEILFFLTSLAALPPVSHTVLADPAMAELPFCANDAGVVASPAGIEAISSGETGATILIRGDRPALGTMPACPTIPCQWQVRPTAHGLNVYWLPLVASPRAGKKKSAAETASHKNDGGGASKVASEKLVGVINPRTGDFALDKAALMTLNQGEIQSLLGFALGSPGAVPTLTRLLNEPHWRIRLGLLASGRWERIPKHVRLDASREAQRTVPSSGWLSAELLQCRYREYEAVGPVVFSANAVRWYCEPREVGGRSCRELAIVWPKLAEFIFWKVWLRWKAHPTTLMLFVIAMIGAVIWWRQKKRSARKRENTSSRGQ